MERQIAELVGKGELGTREIRDETTELIVRESPCSASPQGERPEGPVGRGNGLGGSYSKEGAERFLAAVRKHVAVLETVRSLAREEYERSGREQLTVKKTLRKNFVKLEVVLRPGKPRKEYPPFLAKVEAELALLKKSLGWDRVESE
jgi:hypothetical protein